MFDCVERGLLGGLDAVETAMRDLNVQYSQTEEERAAGWTFSKQICRAIQP